MALYQGAALVVLGAVVEDAETALDVDGSPVPVSGAPGDLEEILADTHADSVAIADPNRSGSAVGVA